MNFYIGQRVIFEGQFGKVTSTSNGGRYPISRYPIRVDWDNRGWDCFTEDGRINTDGPICLFGLEESDNSQQGEDNAPSPDMEAHTWATLELIKAYHNLSDIESNRMAGWLSRLYRAGYKRGLEEND